MAAESRLEGPDLSDDATAGVEPVVTVELGEPPAGDGTAERRAIAAAMHRIEEALREDAPTFGFFQAVRLLERLRPDRVPVGSFDDPAREVVRFAVDPDLAFPTSEIRELRLDGEQPAMSVNFMGLTGPMGVLPHQYSLLLAERIRARDRAIVDFLDLFHHRLISLFYRAWRKYRFTVAREDGAQDPLAAHVADLIGLGLPTVRGRMPFPDDALIHRAGLLAAQPRGAVALQQLIEDVFGVPVEIIQFVGGWYPLQRTDLCVIGDEDEAGRLGAGAVAGDEVWDQQARVRVRLGPLDRDRYEDFLPGRAGHDALAALLRFYSHDAFDFEVQPVLAREHVAGLRLGDAAGPEQQLGWSTWMCSAPRESDADETIFTLQTGAVQ